MIKLKLSKHELHVQQEQLKLYQRLLPALDLKRRQLVMELQKARGFYLAIQQAVDSLETRIGEELPMLADKEFRLVGLVELKSYQVTEQNIVGVKLPFLASIDCAIAEYSLLTTSPWVDTLVHRLQDAIEQRIQVEIAEQRVQLLEIAVRRITQRVNLFEKILIPTTKQNIQKIRIFLGDAERANIVTAKIAKKKHLQKRLAELEED